jgi:hypothetical protein
VPWLAAEHMAREGRPHKSLLAPRATGYALRHEMAPDRE